MITVRPLKDAAMLPGHTRVAAEIDRGWWRKEKLWFDVPSAYAADIREGDCWLMAVLPLAFERGETLRICAPVDAALLANAEKIQRVWAGWRPAFRPVRIKAPVAAPAANRARTGLFFTGGVDSFFSLLHHDAAASANDRIEDLIYVWGYDIPLTKPAAFERKLQTIQNIAAATGKNVITMTTNLRLTRLNRLNWGTHMHGPAVGAAGLLLGGRFKQLLFSSGYERNAPEPWGSHPLTTPLMSTAKTEFIEYGHQTTRFEKTALIAKSDLALAHLHVCWSEESAENCGQCEKCCRTMLTLDLMGALKRAISFPARERLIENTGRMRFKRSVAFEYLTEIRTQAVRSQRSDIVRALDASLAANQT